MKPENFCDWCDKSGGETTCWNWKRCKTDRGYGLATVDGKAWRAHRYSYILAHGMFDLNLFVCHHCDNPSCVNPAHLFLGTVQDNITDKMKKGRHGPSRGILNGCAKLTEKQVLEIRRLRSKSTLEKLGKMFNVSPAMICRICRGYAWRHLYATNT